MTEPFVHRGFMLDVSRHFMPVPEIRRLLTAAAYCGLNRMHWHLTDDQGWRLEIKKYPRLTEFGAFRGDTHFGGVSETEILVAYGPVAFASKAGPLAGNHFLTIVEGQEHLEELGKGCLWNGACDVVFDRYE